MCQLDVYIPINGLQLNIVLSKVIGKCYNYVIIGG